MDLIRVAAVLVMGPGQKGAPTVPVEPPLVPQCLQDSGTLAAWAFERGGPGRLRTGAPSTSSVTV